MFDFDFEFLTNELTPFEADAEAIIEMNEWYDIYYQVDRYMEPLQGVRSQAA